MGFDVSTSDECRTDSKQSVGTTGSKSDQIDRLAERISEQAFSEWYRQREFARNIREGRPYFNGPSKIKPPRKHSPSSLLQCHRKTVYKQLNAPEETEDPTGIYWVGSRFEEDLVVPFLQDEVAGENEYVRNSLWIDFTVESDAGELRVCGATDPVIVDSQAKPILLTEIKSKQSVEDLEAPNTHHKAQLHAYMYGLTKKFDRQVTESILLYGGRKKLNIHEFRIEFDPWFWTNTVLQWATDHSIFRLNDELPPADPEYEWECMFCPYQERCGEGESDYSDLPPDGFVPGLKEYPRNKITEYLEANSDAVLTPTLAHQYPELSNAYEVADWYCPSCTSTIDWQEVDPASEALCPRCAEHDDLVSLSLEVENRWQ